MSIEDLFGDLDKHYCEFKSKSVVVTQDNVRKKIPIENFFKAKFDFDESGKLLDVECFKSEDQGGIDILAFAILGLVSCLSKVSLYASLVEKNRVETDLYLDKLTDYVLQFDLMNDVGDFLKLNRTFDDRVAYNRPLSKWRELHDACSHKSMLLHDCFSTTPLRPNIEAMQNCLSYMYCLSMREDEQGEKALIDTFCKFLPVIWLGSVLSFPDFLTEEFFKKSSKVLPIFKSTVNSSLNKFKLGKQDVLEGVDLTDIEGFSVMLANVIVVNLGYNSEYDFSTLDKKFINDLGSCVGDDFISDYLKTGSAMKYIRVRRKDKLISVKYRGSAVTVGKAHIHGVYEFAKDIKVLGFDMSSFIHSNALTESLFLNFKISRLLTLDTNTYMKEVIEKSREDLHSYERKIKYYTTTNNKLRENISCLKSELKTIKEDYDAVKTDSETVPMSTYNKVFVENTSNINKVECLSQKVSELEDKLLIYENSMSDLLSSLESDECTDIEDVDLSEVIKFLNGFNICFLGGRTDMGDRLRDLGLSNFIQVSNVSDVSRLTSCDFIVSMTKFLSHKVFYGGLSKLGYDRNRNMYYNGTNIETLLMSCYSFINNFFEMQI